MAVAPCQQPVVIDGNPLSVAAAVVLLCTQHVRTVQIQLRRVEPGPSISEARTCSTGIMQTLTFVQSRR